MTTKMTTKITSTIQHLVFSGGGPAGLVNYGALKYLSKMDFWNLKNIKARDVVLLGLSSQSQFNDIIAKIGVVEEKSEAKPKKTRAKK